MNRPPNHNLPSQIKVSSVVKNKLSNIGIEPRMVKKLLADYCEDPKGWSSKTRYPSDPPITKIWRTGWVKEDGVIACAPAWVPSLVSNFFLRVNSLQSQTILIKFCRLSENRLRVVDFSMGHGKVEKGVFRVSTERIENERH